MKVSPVASAPQPVANLDEGHSAGGDRVARAKAAMLGQPMPTDTPTLEEAVDKTQQSLKRIKMHTQRSVNRHGDPINTPEATPSSDTPDSNEQAQKTSEATEPMSPQYAALAKAKRALQAKEREVAVREQALKSTQSETQTTGYTKDQIKANALSILREAGVTNDELTDAIINETQGYSPGYSKLETEIKALKESLDTRSKAEVEREQAVERQVLSQVRRDVDSLVSQSDEYEAVVAAKAQDSVVKLIHTVFTKGWADKGYEPGYMMDLEEAARIVDDQLIDDYTPFASLKKVQSRLNPTPVQQEQPAKQSAPNTRIMRTLTNRDGASPTMYKRARAIAAMEGRLK